MGAAGSELGPVVSPVRLFPACNMQLQSASTLESANAAIAMRGDGAITWVVQALAHVLRRLNRLDRASTRYKDATRYNINKSALVYSLPRHGDIMAVSKPRRGKGRP